MLSTSCTPKSVAQRFDPLGTAHTSRLRHTFMPQPPFLPRGPTENRPLKPTIWAMHSSGPIVFFLVFTY